MSQGLRRSRTSMVSCLGVMGRSCNADHNAQDVGSAVGGSLFLSLCGTPECVLAQPTGVAIIRGSVQDQTGAVVPAVRVKIVDSSGAVRAETGTDAARGFVFSGIPPGEYELRTAFEGFTPATARLGRAIAALPPRRIQLSAGVTF